MAERAGRPLPQIDYIPGMDPRRSKTRRGDLVLSQPGVAHAIEVLADLGGADSAARRAYIVGLQAQETRRPRQHEDLVTALGRVSSGDLTDSTEMRAQASLIYEKLYKGDETVRYEFGHPFFDILQDEGIYATHIQGFGEYRTADEQKKRGIAKNRATQIFNNPKDLNEHAKAVAILSEQLENDQTEVANEYRAYNADVRQRLMQKAETPELAPLERKDLLEWMKVLTFETEHTPVAEVLLKNWLATDDPDEVVNRVHQLASAVYPYDNIHMDRKLLEITCFMTDILPFDSIQAIEYVMAHGVGPLTVRQQRREIEEAERFIAGSFPGLAMRRIAQRQRQISSPKAKEKRAEFRRRIANQESETGRSLLWERIREGSPVKAWKRMFAQESLDSLDDDTMMTASVLRRWINEEMVYLRGSRRKKLGRSKRIVENVQLPGITRVIKGSVDQVAGQVHDRLGTFSEQEFDEPGHWRTLALVVPENIDQSKLDGLSELSDKMRKTIKDERLRDISQRGDIIHVKDAGLTSLGFKTIEVIPNNGETYRVRLHIGDNYFVGEVDQSWTLLNTDFRAPLRLPVTGAFLEQVIVSHIHELTCGPVKEGSNGDEGTNQFYSRRAHQHTLPLGQQPSEAQILKALLVYKVDLIKRNQDRIAGGETQLVTWNSATERIDKAGKGPVKSSAENATVQMNEILAA